MENQQSVRQAQAADFLAGDTTPYIGSWVAVRAGEVVASAASLKLLSKYSVIQAGDTFMFVDPPGLTQLS